MKIGIHTFHLENLLKAGYSKEDTIQALNPANHIKHCIGLGIKNFEVTYDINLMIADMDLQEIVGEMLELKKKHGLSYSVHLPFRGVDLCYPDDGMGRAYAELMAKAIKMMEPLGPEAYVIHPTGDLGSRLSKRLPVDSYIIQSLIKHSRFVLKNITDKSGINSRKLAVENLKFPFTALQGMIEELDLSVCLDAGHLAAGYSGALTHKEFIDRYLDRIIEIHLHDAYRRQTEDGLVIEDHLQLGKGDLDWKWLLGYLVGKGYDKRIILEMKFNDALQSLEKIKSATAL